MPNKILVIGDLHLKEKRGYADYIADARKTEESKILDFIVSSAADCDTVVFLGDQLNSKNNTSGVIREFVSLVERLNNKQVYIIAGNHEKHGDGRSAIDFLKEIEGKHWHVITDKVEMYDDMVFCPYFSKTEFGTEDNNEALEKLLKTMPDAKFLFAHHALSGSKVHSTMVNLFNEIVLPTEVMAKKYSQVFAGHIHNYQELTENVVVVGSVFCDEAGEVVKYLAKTDGSTIEKLRIPSRSIYSLQDPTITDLDLVPKENVIKAILTIKKSEAEIEELKNKLRTFDAYVLLEQYPKERRKAHIDTTQNILELETEKLLEMYATQNKVDLAVLLHGWSLIKSNVN